jgi:hypothetical protein
LGYAAAPSSSSSSFYPTAPNGSGNGYASTSGGYYAPPVVPVAAQAQQPVSGSPLTSIFGSLAKAADGMNATLFGSASEAGQPYEQYSQAPSYHAMTPQGHDAGYDMGGDEYGASSSAGHAYAPPQAANPGPPPTLFSSAPAWSGNASAGAQEQQHPEQQYHEQYQQGQQQPEFEAQGRPTSTSQAEPQSSAPTNGLFQWDAAPSQAQAAEGDGPGSSTAGQSPFEAPIDQDGAPVGDASPSFAASLFGGTAASAASQAAPVSSSPASPSRTGGSSAGAEDRAGFAAALFAEKEPSVSSESSRPLPMSNVGAEKPASTSAAAVARAHANGLYHADSSIISEVASDVAPSAASLFVSGATLAASM